MTRENKKITGNKIKYVEDIHLPRLKAYQAWGPHENLGIKTTTLEFNFWRIQPIEKKLMYKSINISTNNILKILKEKTNKAIMAKGTQTIHWNDSRLHLINKRGGN